VSQVILPGAPWSRSRDSRLRALLQGLQYECRPSREFLFRGN
jgi:hypothetical protein